MQGPEIIQLQKLQIVKKKTCKKMYRFSLENLTANQLCIAQNTKWHYKVTLLHSHYPKLRKES